MTRTIFIFGVISGVLVAVPMFSHLLLSGGHAGDNSLFVGYAIMLAALSLIFVGTKGYRDKALGGAIKFLPAFLMGLGISTVAGAIYVVGWEITLALTDYAFIEQYAASMLEAERAAGASAAELEAKAAEIAQFSRDYRNPMFRLPMTFIEIFPVGLLISLISAALLRNSGFLPARKPLAA